MRTQAALYGACVNEFGEYCDEYGYPVEVDNYGGPASPVFLGYDEYGYPVWEQQGYYGDEEDYDCLCCSVSEETCDDLLTSFYVILFFLLPFFVYFAIYW